MFREWLERYRDWTGDRQLTRAIRAALRDEGYAVNASKTRRVRLAAIRRPGWEQVFRFEVEAYPRESDPQAAENEPILLHGLSRNDGRESKTEVCLTEDLKAWEDRLDAWSEGMIRR